MQDMDEVIAVRPREAQLNQKAASWNVNSLEPMDLY